MADQFTYEVEIPGKGKFHVDSGAELTDAQAYAYASAQATHEAAAPTVGMGEDVARAAASAPPRAVTGALGMPRATSDMTQAALAKIASTSLPDWLKSTLTVGVNAMPGVAGARAIGGMLPSTQDIRGAVASVPGLGFTDYTPQTGPGRYTQAVGEGATAGAVGGVPGILSGALSGAGGEAGSDIGGRFGPVGAQVGRVLGSVGAGFAPSVWQAYFGNRAAQLVKNAGITPDQFDAGIARQNAANAQGAPLTGPEALANPQLLALQRQTETAPSSTTLMQQFLQRRAQQTGGAVGNELNAIGPVPENPALVASKTQQAAEGSLNQARQAVNAKASPMYQASDASRVDSQTWNSLISDPAMESALRAVRREPLLKLQYEPEGSMRWIDAAKKYLDAAANPGLGAGALERTAARGATQTTTSMLPAVDAQVPSYPKARGIVEQGMEASVKPLEVGPLGKIASGSPTVKAQFDALTNPEKDVTTTLASQAAQRLKMNDPDTFRDLLRSGMETQLDSALSAKTSDATRVGERFYKGVFETPQQADNVRAILRELPNGKTRVAAFDNLMETLRLQAGRLPTGSPTVEKGAMAAQTMPNGMAKFMREPLQTTGNWVGKVLGGDANADLARLFTSKDSVSEIQRLAITKPGSYQAGALISSLLGISEQSGPAPQPQR